MRLKKYSLIILLAAIFVVSAAYSLYFRIHPSVDAKAYDRIAWNMSSGNGYREMIGIPLEQDSAILRVGPGYEYFLAAIYFIFGRQYWLVWLIQALLLAGTAGLAYLLSREIFGSFWNKTIGLAVAALVGLSPDLITVSGMLMAETLAVFLIVLTAWLFFRYYNECERRQESCPWLVAAFSLSLGAAALVRSPVIFLFLPWTYLLLKGKRYKSWLLSVALVVLVFSPWIARNYLVFHQFIPTNLVVGADLAIGNHHGASGELEPYPRADEYRAAYGMVAANKMLNREVVDFVMQHPLEFLQITANRISIYFSFARPTGFWPHLSGLSKILTLALSLLYSVIIFIFGFWGIYFSRNLPVEERKRTNYLLALLVMMPLAIICIIVESRYRFLAYPFFAIFAAYGLANFWSKRKEWQPLALIAGVLFINFSLDLLKLWSRIAERIGQM